MFCPRCDSPVPPGANFCMRCGSPLARREGTPAAPQSVPANAPAAVDSATIWRAKYLPTLLIVGVLLAVFFLGLMASNALQARAAMGQDSLQVPHKTLPTLVATAQRPPGMPVDVHDWLEHLRRIEEQKNKLAADQVAQLKVFMSKYQALGPAAGLLSNSGDDEDNTNPVQPMKEQTLNLTGAWKDLIKDYQSVPPPPECQQLADEYFAGLNEVPAQMGDVEQVVNSIVAPGEASQQQGDAANKDALSKAYSMEGKSGDIDAHFGRSDELLGQICQQYNTSKWFSISTDIGGGALSTPF